MKELVLEFSGAISERMKDIDKVLITAPNIKGR